MKVGESKKWNRIAHELGCHPFEAVTAIELAKAEELRPGLQRWREKVARNHPQPTLQIVASGEVHE